MVRYAVASYAMVFHGMVYYFNKQFVNLFGNLCKRYDFIGSAVSIHEQSELHYKNSEKIRSPILLKAITPDFAQKRHI